MPLTFDLKDVKNAYIRISKEEYDENEKSRSIMPKPSYYDAQDDAYYQMTTLCNMLIFVCGQLTGIPTITEKNYKQVADRIKLMEKLTGCFLYNYNPETESKEPLFITEDNVKDHIGLKTNGTRYTKSEFIKIQLKHYSL